MADLSRKTASIYINHAAAEEALKKLQSQADKLSISIKKGEDAGKNMVKEIGRLNDTKNQIAGVQRQIDQGLKPSFNQLQALVAKTRAELRKMSESDPGFLQKTKDLNKYSTELNRLGTRIGAVKKESGGLKGMLADMLPVIGWAAAGAAIAGFFKGAVDEALEADKAAGKLQGTLENLGKADAFDRLADKADAMAERFKFIDNDDVIGVFDQLITYGKLTEAQMDKLTPVIINFAAKSRKSLDESTKVIIKALEGSGRELKEYGVNVTAAMSQSERLAAVMTDLGDKVNGAADAFGETTQGKIADTQQEIKNLKEEVGTGLLPVLRRSLEGVNALIDGVKFFFMTQGQVTRERMEDLAKIPGELAEHVATEMGAKSIPEQQKLADSYKAIYISSQKALSDFLKSSNRNNKAERDRLLAQQEQDEKIYLATQRTLQESIAVQKKNGQKQEDEDAKKEAAAAAKEAARKREEATKKAIEEAKRLRKIWDDLAARINDPFALMADDPMSQAFKKATDQAAKDTAQAKMLFDKRIIDYKNYADAIVRIEEIRRKQISDIVKKYSGPQSNISFDPDNPSLAKPLNTTGPISPVNPNTRNVELSREKVFQDDFAGLQLKAIQSAGKKRLQAELNILDVQQAQELANKDLTENQKLLIEEDYRQRRAQAEKEHYIQIAQMVMDGAQQLANVFSMFNQANEADDQDRLNQNQKNYDDDKNKLDRQLRQKIVSQKEYDRQLKALDDKKRKEDAAIKKKEFERNKTAQIINAIMNGANAVIHALDYAPPLSFVFAGLATAMTAAQIAVIQKQKVPEFAKGGLLDGPRHAQGGMPVLNRSGQKVAEVEGGEAILSRKTVKNNFDIVNQLLRASMYGNGQRIVPYWQQRSSYTPVNYSGISRSMDRVRYFEKGGVIPVSNESSTVVNNTTVTDNSEILQAAMIIREAAANIRAYVLLSDVNAAQDIQDRIKKETTISR